MTVAPWQRKSPPRMLVPSKAAFLENYLAVSTWVLNGSSIECHEKKVNLSVYLVFDLEAGRFKFLGENLLGASNFWGKICLEPSIIFQVEWLTILL